MHSRYPRYPFTYHFHENSGNYNMEFTAVVLNLFLVSHRFGVMAGPGWIPYALSRVSLIHIQNTL